MRPECRDLRFTGLDLPFGLGFWEDVVLMGSNGVLMERFNDNYLLEMF